MKREEEMEKILRAAPAPRLRAGMHRQLLKAQLLEAMEKGARPMTNVSWKRSLAWVCALALALTSAAWGGKKIYMIYVTEREHRSLTQTMVGPDGNKIQRQIITKGVEVNAEDMALSSTEQARVAREAESLIRAGKAQKVKVEGGQKGAADFIYTVELADGRQVEYRSKRELSNVTGAENIRETILVGAEKNQQTGITEIRTLAILKDGNDVMVSVAGAPEAYGEIPQLIEQGKGRAVETRTLKDGKTLKIYEVTLSSGETVNWGVLSGPGDGKK